ncbi:MAG: histidine--tRNA ligase [Pseudomonadota bacterium]
MIQLVRGFKDILPPETDLWQHIEDEMRNIFESFGFKHIRTPIVEQTELFARGIGTTTDIVEKEMYSIANSGDESLSLRPEATASVVRAYVEHKLYTENPIQKLYTIGPMFRRERPQKGRYRQFYQINAEALGLALPEIDAELILMISTLMKRLSAPDIEINLNSLGCQGCRPSFRKELRAFIADKVELLCPDCKRRMDTNPLRVFDCKAEGCRKALEDAPDIIQYLCDPCKEHFEKVQNILNRFQIGFKLNPRLVRGLDYYMRTAFEFITPHLGSQSAVAGGGRYDGLVKALDGPDLPGVGFAIGLDRLAALLSDRIPEFSSHPMVFIAALGRQPQYEAIVWLENIRLLGVRCEMDFENRSLKSQMRQADRLGSTHALIVGEDELNKGNATWRDMKTKEQVIVPLAEIVTFIVKNLGKEKL